MNVIQEIEREQISAVTAKRGVPEFGPGDTVKVMVKVIEGDNVRTQAYEGVVIGRSGAGINENFTVRKISYGEGVERVFPVYSPYIAEIDADLASRLRQLNAIKFEQIANLSDDDIANLDETLQLGGRIEKDDWVGQAQSLLTEASAAEVPAEEEAKA